MGHKPRQGMLCSCSDFLFTVLVLLLWLLMAKPGHTLSARLSHDGGNGNATRAALSDSLELEDAGTDWGYGVFARRDDLSNDRTLINAAAIVSARKRLAEHAFYLGLGAHFRQQKLNARSAEAADFLPAAGFLWQHESFHADITASEKLTRASLAFLITAGIPWELNSEFEALYSQPYRWSANIFAFVSRHGGGIFGYEPAAGRMRAGLWLKPLENLQLRSLMRFAAGSETFWEFSLSYQFSPQRDAVAEPAVKIAAVEPQKDVRKKKPQSVPAFATLVKWGLTPVEALRFAREKEICNLSAAAQAALKRHRWECRS